MREILFRGKLKVDNGEHKKGDWVFGDLVRIKDGEKTSTMIYGFGEVDPSTVGQYTGLTDKNGTKVFEGDILVFCKGATYPYKIEWDGMGWKLYRSDGKRIKEAFECNEIHYVNISEVIGNIHDNPELLGGVNNGST